MKRENLEQAQSLIEKASQIEYILQRINDKSDFSTKWDWIPAALNLKYLSEITLTPEEEMSMSALKDAMTAILERAAERTLASINNRIDEL